MLLFHDQILDQSVWMREHLSPADWLVSFPDACIAELDEAIQIFDRRAQPVQDLTLEMFPNLTACRQAMAQVQTKLLDQTGLAIVDRIPIAQYSKEQNRAIYWLLGQMLGRIVDQKWTGTSLYDVKDFGKKLGYGVRRSITNLGQPFHTDGPWLSMPPEIVSLFCLQTAETGGKSLLVSLTTVHDQMQQRHPDLLERLYQPFIWDRQAEHDPDDDPYSAHPVFEYDGHGLIARYYDDYIRKGYALAGDELDAKGKEALDALQTIINDPANAVDFRVETGQIQYVNNRRLAHARTQFADNKAASVERHLIRCWYRNAGLQTLEGRPES